MLSKLPKWKLWTWAVTLVGVGLIVASLAASGAKTDEPKAPAQAPKVPEVPTGDSINVTPAQAEEFKFRLVEDRPFVIKREAVGSIAFNEEMVVDVFPPVQGKLLKLFARAGDDVTSGAPLYTIDSPDLVQTESTLISAAGLLALTTRALERAKELKEVQGISAKELDQTVADQQAAEAALKAARDAVRIFGKTDREMDAIIAQRKIDPALVVPAPISGRVTARNAAPGQLAQPGNSPAPYTIADVASMWMLADVSETDFGVLKIGQEIDVAVRSYPDRVWKGKIVNIGASVDPATRRVTVRSEISDPGHELRSGMFATFVIKIGSSVAAAVPQNGVIREGDGTVSVWITSDRKTLVRRSVKTGLRQDGFVEIVEGIKAGELVATESALFLSSALQERPQ